MENFLATTMKADKVIRFQFSLSIFKIVYTDRLKARLT